MKVEGEKLEKLVRACGIAALVASSGASAADFSGPYLGADLGVGRNKISGSVSTPTKDGTSGGVQGGYNWNVGDNWMMGADLFYDQTASQGRNLSPTGTIQFGDRTYGLDAKFGYTIDKLLPYFRLGYGRIKGTDDASSYSQDGVHAGLGLEYMFANNWSFGGELGHLAGKESSGIRLTDNSLLFSLKYYFGAKTQAPTPMPVANTPPPAPPAPKVEAPPPPPPPRIEKYTLSATELFAFDSAELKMPQPKLDEIANALNSNPGVNAVIVGYSDRLGSDRYNLKLSERRANAVKDYLAGKGIPASRLTAEGKGKADPVVTCKERKRAALIKCLEPNRRVEVQEMTFERKVQ